MCVRVFGSHPLYCWGPSRLYQLCCNTIISHAGGHSARGHMTLTRPLLIASITHGSSFSAGIAELHIQNCCQALLLKPDNIAPITHSWGACCNQNVQNGNCELPLRLPNATSSDSLVPRAVSTRNTLKLLTKIPACIWSRQHACHHGSQHCRGQVMAQPAPAVCAPHPRRKDLQARQHGRPPEQSQLCRVGLAMLARSVR